VSRRPSLRRALAGDVEVPSDVVSERALLGLMLLSPEITEYVHNRLTADDWWQPQHARLFDMLVELYRAGHPTDATAALSVAIERALPGLDGPLIFDLVQAASGTPEWLVGRLREKTLRRELLAVGLRITQGAMQDASRSAEALVEMARVDMERVGHQSIAEAPPMPISTFVQTELEWDWLVSGLIERQERVMITAPESFGKSTLMRQLVVCLASGIHPFDWTPGPPHPTLLVDCENPPGLNQRRYRPLLAAARSRSDWTGDGLWIDSRPEGLDLTQATDAARLVRRIRLVKPEIVVIGPIYKLFTGDANDEQVARRVTAVIDYIRGHFGCAVVLEAHSPHGDGTRSRPVRPYGASLWRRWPDFGLGLQPIGNTDPFDKDRAARLVQWKARDERSWPAGLRAGGGPWPWIPMTQDEIDMHREGGRRELRNNHFGSAGS
jgi:hypothetical protein